MRVSTHLVFQRGADAIGRGQSQLVETQQRIATGRRMLTPADDPIAASRALETSQAQRLAEQYIENQGAARDGLRLAESALGDAGNVLQQARELLVAAGDGALTGRERATIADELQSRLAELIGLANARDGAGGFLFAGYRETVQPFTATPAGAAYNGDQGRRELAVGPGRALAVSEAGSEIFERVRNGNGTFVTAAAPANAGGAVVSVGRVLDPTAVTGDAYQIVFTVAAGVATYAVVDTTTSATLSTGNPYTSGGAIQFDGMQVEVTGQPASGDVFTVAPSTSQSVFKTLADAAAALRADTYDPASAARLEQGRAGAIANLDQALDRLLGVRTGFGARLRELDDLDAATQAQALEQSARLSDLQDLDYTQAASDLAREAQALEAAQLSYKRVTQLSLFDYL